ncbi:low molecular weight phosphotyrosine protein phosphatase [Helicobacter aurati]|uniref:protein-tyrosine-phosphatase n=1 Tax=Helicobacter aurati TaxID=137778 RepID=A0A3D8J3C8_9HELI|nr:low molecular weight protein-tyrosine-phosphatase [Helicobacter aurati]RDU71655.1 low molecular weight phosphotyrosine protein phosphatase [Helicobacter aurati]
MKIRSILFVCLGNICRSPLAEGIARDMNNRNAWNLQLDSCGTSSFHLGENPHTYSVLVAQRNGIDISQLQSRPINFCDDKHFDIIIGMDSQNKRDILNLGFETNKVFKLGDFGDGEDIPDPYYFKDDRGFIMVYELIESLLKKMFQHYGFILYK